MGNVAKVSEFKATQLHVMPSSGILADTPSSSHTSSWSVALLHAGKNVILTLRQCQNIKFTEFSLPQKVIPIEGCTVGPKNFESLL